MIEGLNLVKEKCLNQGYLLARWHVSYLLFVTSCFFYTFKLSIGFIIEGLLLHGIKLTGLWVFEAFSVILHIHAHINKHGCTSRTFGCFARNPLSVPFSIGGRRGGGF